MKALMTFFVFAFATVSMWAKPVSTDSLEKRVQALEMQITHQNCGGQMHNGMGEPCKNEMEENVMIQKCFGNPAMMKMMKFVKEKELGKQRCEVQTLPFSNKLLVLSPLAFSIIIVIILFFLLKRSGFSLREALSSKQTDANGQVSLHPSSSKLLAFLSIVAGLMFASFFFMFYFYFAFKHCPLPNFCGLWPVVTIIGIGILPYIFQCMFKK